MAVYFDNRQKLTLPKNIEEILEKVIDISLISEDFDSDYEISFSFVDENEIRKLNANYRGMNSITDVLSFPTDSFNDMPIIPLGDIVLCVSRAYEQAKEIGNTKTYELIYLTIHSVLHLLGYDHMDKDEKIIMRNSEKKIIKKIDILNEK